MTEIWIIVEFTFNGTATRMPGKYATWEDACKVQEKLERKFEENAYLIYTEDEWQWNEQLRRY